MVSERIPEDYLAILREKGISFPIRLAMPVGTLVRSRKFVEMFWRIVGSIRAGPIFALAISIGREIGQRPVLWIDFDADN